jgi:hypothetical protein
MRTGKNSEKSLTPTLMESMGGTVGKNNEGEWVNWKSIN